MFALYIYVGKSFNSSLFVSMKTHYMVDVTGMAVSKENVNDFCALLIKMLSGLPLDENRQDHL